MSTGLIFSIWEPGILNLNSHLHTRKIATQMYKSIVNDMEEKLSTIVYYVGTFVWISPLTKK